MTLSTEARNRLQGRLLAEAQTAGLLELTYRTMDSPIGELLLVKSEKGLVRISFEVEDHDRVLASLADKVSPRILEGPDSLDLEAGQIDQYFAGTRHEFTVSRDLRLVKGFQREVLIHLETIGWGRTESYSDVAAEVGNPKAVRAVGTACAVNPLPLIVPCHRVLKADGSTGNYRGGPEAKRRLLAIEGRESA